LFPFSKEELAQHTKDNSLIRYGASVARENSGRIVAIAEIHSNPQYKEETAYYKFDVALLKTQDPIELKHGVAEALILADKGLVHPPNFFCDLASYGKTGVESVDAEQRLLRFTQMAPLDDEICKEILTLVDGLFCAYQLRSTVCDVSWSGLVEGKGY
jgi:Trypsin